MKKIRAVVLVALLAVLGASPALGAQPDSAQWVPLKGTLSGQAQFLPADDCLTGLATTVEGARGVASHLGRTMMSGRHCTPTGDDFGPGEMTLTAANGDALYMTYTGSAPFPAPGTEVIVGTTTATITGGTGRFEDATGTVEMVIEIQFEGFEDPSWAATWTMTGMINY
jgi:hypothetical protein